MINGKSVKSVNFIMMMQLAMIQHNFFHFIFLMSAYHKNFYILLFFHFFICCLHTASLRCSKTYQNLIRCI